MDMPLRLVASHQPSYKTHIVDMTDSITLGMPHLCGHGLSEQWLLKTLGDYHWRLLAKLSGRKHPDFRDEMGAPVYATFCALHVKHADFSALKEHDTLIISSKLMALSRTQVASEHALYVSERLVGTVELVSTFVRRLAAGNHAVARYPVMAAFMPETGTPLPAPFGAKLAEEAAHYRAGKLQSCLDFALAGAEHQSETGVKTYTFDPVPSLDFNGAGFLYFASFQAFIDRAEWAHVQTQGAPRTPLLNTTKLNTAERVLYFAANLDPGEKLQVIVKAWRSHGASGNFSHHCKLVNAKTGKVLGDCFTHRVAN